MKLDIRNKEGKQVELVEGMWYVGVNHLDSDSDSGYGEIAQYVGNDEFYDEGSDEPTRMQDYEYLVESHMGRIAA